MDMKISWLVGSKPNSGGLVGNFSLPTESLCGFIRGTGF